MVEITRTFGENMAKNGVEMEMKDSAAFGGKNISSPKGQRPNYESLKEVNDNNGKVECTCKNEL